MASFLYLVLGSILYFFGFRISPLVGSYLLYLVVVASLGGVVREWMGNKECPECKGDGLPTRKHSDLADKCEDCGGSGKVGEG